jgi:aspartate aminotransferase
MEQTTTTPGRVSRLLEQLTESATLAMARLSRELAQQGHDIVSLSLGEPDFDTPDYIKDAAKKAIDNNITHYPPVNGFLDVRKAIAAKFLRDNGLTYSSEQIVVSTGAKQSIANAVLALINPGDEVIMPSPYWVSYSEMVKIAGGVPLEVTAGLDQQFKISAAQLAAAITPRTKMIIFSSPCNPSGSVFSEEELRAMAEVIVQHEELYVISDEIYEFINYSGKSVSIATMPGMYERTVTVNGVSKAYAMTGWRIGYIGAPKWIADACTKMQGQITSGTGTISQMAAKAAVEADPAVIQPMIEVFRTRRDLMYSLLSDIPGLKTNLPEGAFYFFPDVSAFLGKKYNGEVIETAAQLSMYMLRHFQVATVSGESFGDPSCIRLSYAASESDIRKACERIRTALLALI